MKAKLLTVVFFLLLIITLSIPGSAATNGNTVAVTATAPVPGQAPSYTVSVTGVDYDTIYDVYWWVVNKAGGNAWRMTETETFQYDYEYVLKLTLIKNDVAHYYDGITSGTVNNNACDLYPSYQDTSYIKESTLHIEYNFGKSTRTPITDIYLDGYKPLRVGMENISLTKKSGYSANYSLITGKYVEPARYGGWDDVYEFKEGNKYYLFISMSASFGYDFSTFQKSGIHIAYGDGELEIPEDTVINSSVDHLYIYFPDITLEAKVLDINCRIDEPKEGITPASTASIPSGAEYKCTGIDWYVSNSGSLPGSKKMVPGQKFELGMYYYAEPHFSYDTDTYDRYDLTVNGESCKDKENGHDFYYPFGQFRKDIIVYIDYDEPKPGALPAVTGKVPSGVVYTCNLVWYEIKKKDGVIIDAREMEPDEVFVLGHMYASIPVLKLEFNKYRMSKWYINGKDIPSDVDHLEYGPLEKLAQPINTKSSYSIAYGSTMTLKPGTATKTSYKTSNKKVATVTNKGVIKITGIGTAKITVTAVEDDTHKKTTKTITINGVPKKPTIAKLTSGKKLLTVKMKTKASILKASAYQYAYRLKGTKKWKTKNAKTQSLNIKKLKKGKTYYVRVRAYKKVGTKTYYGAWSKTKLSKKIK